MKTPERVLDHYLSQLRRIFSQPDRRAAHHQCQPILRQLAQDPEFLPGIIRHNLATPGFLERTRINPVLAMDIDKNAEFEFIMHGWMPLPDRSTDLSHQSIHHHGNLLLTSVSPLGPGYESILFQPDFAIDSESGIAHLQPSRYYANALHNLEFIDSRTPHVVFYPPAVSITYALWCSEKPAVGARLKGSRLVQKYKGQAKSVLKALGLAKAAGLNVVEFFDFYLAEQKVWALKERITYPEGTHENYIQNLFHFLQQVAFDDYDFIRGLNEPSAAVTRWKTAYLKQAEIPDSFEPNHLSIPKVNLSKPELLSHFKLGQPIAQ